MISVPSTRRNAASHLGCAGQAGAVDDVVETGLEDRQDVLTGPTGAVGGFLEVAAELLLHDAVGEAGLLLLLQLQEVLGGLAATAAAAARPKTTTPEQNATLLLDLS